MLERAFLLGATILGVVVLSGGASASAPAQPAWARDGLYAVTVLGTFGGADGSASSINQTSVVAGTANRTGDVSSEAAVWFGRRTLGLGTLGGLNSGIDWPNHNNFGLVAGISETAHIDPLGEDWSCQAFFPTVPDTKHVCRGFAWYGAKLFELPTLGGENGYAAGTNDLNQIVGWAETTVHDPTCTAVTKVPNSFYQVLRFEPVVYEPNGRVRRLPTVHGDPDGAATAINDRGDAVGISGACDQAVGRFTAAHAVFWHGGTATDIGNFGGISWNTPSAINNLGQVAGFANLPGDTNGQFQPIGFVWDRHAGLRKILPLSGDTNSLANGINDLGQVVGESFNANTGAARAFIWENGRTMDLNRFLPAGTTVHLVAANDIDDRGDVVGQATIAGTSQAPPFLAVPRRRFDPAAAYAVSAPRSSPALAPALGAKLLRRYGVRVPGTF